MSHANPPKCVGDSDRGNGESHIVALRSLVADAFRALSTGENRWYSIRGDKSDKHSLAYALDMDEQHYFAMMRHAGLATVTQNTRSNKAVMSVHIEIRSLNSETYGFNQLQEDFSLQLEFTQSLLRREERSAIRNAQIAMISKTFVNKQL